ncbi:MAG: hypothetical protein BGO41_00960 [Clostridiales bacterium 38-18]|nr:MAG: hypothetical protein BGO41_00960 [Clostridiales bacterium 38-18]
MARNYIQEFGKDKVLNDIYEQIQEVYKSDNRPWVIGYSGGKDSTVTCMLIIEAISRLPENERKKEIHIVSSDTLVENPLILNYLALNINLMQQYSVRTNLNVMAKLITPDLNDSFWVLMIGKGYPTPRQKFRWCTSRLKIKPIDQYIEQMAKENGSVVVVLGVRSAESNSRSESIKKNTVEGKILKKHATNKDAFVYAPIEHLSNDDIWACLMNSQTPWGTDGNTLLSLYMDASDESECPIQQDANAPSCGQSRFGCWTCTVVTKDKSLSGFIINGYDELRPLLSFRNFIYTLRDNVDYRQNYRMDGSIYQLGTGEDARRGVGPFNMKGRKLMLEKLLEAEEQFNQSLATAEKSKFSIPNTHEISLIKKEELELIRQHWIDDGDWEDSLPIIYKNVKNKDYYFGYVNQPFSIDSDLNLLEEICKQEEVDLDLIKSLITIENKYQGLKKRSGIIKALDKTLHKDIVHEELYELNRGE